MVNSRKILLIGLPKSIDWKKLDHIRHQLKNRENVIFSDHLRKTFPEHIVNLILMINPWLKDWRKLNGMDKPVVKVKLKILSSTLVAYVKICPKPN